MVKLAVNRPLHNRPEGFNRVGMDSAELPCKQVTGYVSAFVVAAAMQHYLIDAVNNRGLAFYKLNQNNAALADYNKAILLNPDYAEAYSNRGLLLNDLKQYDAALADYDKSIAVDPDFSDAYWYKGLLKLLLGDYQEGWKLYEWRWKTQSMVKAKVARVTAKPLWLGRESLVGKAIILYEEQGQGDSLQFCRYIPMLAALGAKVFFEVSSSMAGLASTLKGNPVIVKKGEPLPEFDFHCPLMSLPLAFATRVETIPSESYLSTQPEYVEKWRPVLADKLGKDLLRVGLCWAGGVRPDHPDAMRIDAIRSLRFAQLKPLLDCKNSTFVSLQLGPPKDQLDDNRVLDISSELKNWSDTAAVISLLDLVITVDTSVCHLAGALGKKFWLLNRYETCWRWFLEREDSPWYPTARVFRQQKPGDWESVIARVKEELSVILLSKT